MAVFKDYRGRNIEFTDERRGHILDHPEMVDWIDRLDAVLANPDVVIRSRSDGDVELFYSWKTFTRLGPKYLCAVVIAKPRRAFIVTAYLTDTIKRGEELWRRPKP